MNILALARYVAAALGLLTFAGLFFNDAWRSDSVFLVPDLLVSVFLFVSALLTRPLAVAALLFAFGLATGVFTTAAFSYVVRGEFGIFVSVFAVTCLTVAAALVREIVVRRSGQ